MHFLRRLRERSASERLSALQRWIRSAPDSACAGVAPGLSLATRPGSTKRVRLSYRPEEITGFVAGVFSVPPENR
jgi:hypothetical protein